MTRELKPCGTPAAYMRHIKAKQKPCEPCRLAWNAYQVDRRQDPDIRMADREQNRDSRIARYRALTRLAELHPKDFRALNAEERQRLRDEEAPARTDSQGTT